MLGRKYFTILLACALMMYGESTYIDNSCPPKCTCVSQKNAIPASYCNGLKLETVPRNIAKNTELLTLRLNNIKNLTDLDLSGLYNLRRLNLVYNNIEHISDNAFNDLRKLRSLNLGYNNLKTLSTRVFRNLISLEELFINNNLLQTLPKDIFSLLPNLKRLSLQSNQIVDDPNEVFANLNNLEMLNLAHNKLNTITSQMFKNSQKLKYLYLDDNKIKSIDKDALRSLTELTEIYLDNNALVTLSENLLSKKTELTRVSLYNNPFRCDCNLYWMHDAIIAGIPTFQYTVKTICQSPLELERKPISTLHRDNFDCFGSWSSWLTWSECDKPCSGGYRHRKRMCQTNARSDNGSSCKGNENDSEACNTFPCSRGVLSRWSEWSPCSATCNEGIRRRERKCINPYTGDETNSCDEALTEKQACTDKQCPINGGWASWSGWSDCDKKCGLGMKSRTRTCTKPSPRFGGEICIGGHVTKQSKICFKALCPPKIHWSTWSSYSECSSSCEKGRRVRTRSCINEYNRTIDILNVCPGSSTEIVDCIAKSPCNQDGGWSNWMPWSSCTPMSCKRYRSRRCDNPSPYSGGKDCQGENQEDESCDPKDCIVHAIWSQWQSWSACSNSCNGGTRKRYRSCPGEQFKRVTCGKKRSEIQICNVKPCVEPKWSDWGEWTSCSESSKQVRRRSCTGVGKKKCPGKDKERRVCQSIDWQKVVITADDKKCQTRKVIPNGYETIKRKGKLLIAEYKCNKHYRLKKGSPSRTVCVEGKGWSTKSSQYCVPICGKPVHKSRNHWSRRARLLGGEYTIAHSWPWQVAIEVNTRLEGWKLRCGGSLLGDRWIVTAGHCLFDKDPTRLFEPHEIKIFLGVHNVTRRYKDKFVQILEAGHVEAHPEFDHPSLNNDIGLIELKEKVELSDKVLPVCLPSSKQRHLSKRGQTGTVIGWGVTNSGKASPVLQELELPVVSRKECFRAYANHYNVTRSMFCAGKKSSSEDTCKGDSGGGYLFHDPRKNKWTIQGIVSWGGKRCGEPGKFSVYTRVLTFTQWIRRVMRNRMYVD